MKLLTIAAVCLALAGCARNHSERNEHASPAPSTPDSNGASMRIVHDQPYEGPAVTLVFLQQPMHPPKNVVSVNITAPSGGWNLMLDKGEVVNETARLYLTLFQPAPGQATTRALVDLQANFNTHESFRDAEVYINLTAQGSKHSAEYRLAKRQFVDEAAQPPPSNSGVSTPPSAGEGSTPCAPGGTVSDEQYTYPELQLQITQAKRLPPISTVSIVVNVPTGGWSLNLDHAYVEGDTAFVFLTIEKPGQDKWVTQALETLNAQFTSETPFTKARVYVHQAQSDVQTLTTNYRLAATVAQ